MKMTRVLICVAAAALAFGDLTDTNLLPWGAGGGLPAAYADVGNPLTPLSYAGVARRTSRRVARRTSYRVNSLPPGCVYGPYYGGTYYKCGGTYYQKDGNVYVQIVFN